MTGKTIAVGALAGELIVLRTPSPPPPPSPSPPPPPPSPSPPGCSITVYNQCGLGSGRKRLGDCSSDAHPEPEDCWAAIKADPQCDTSSGQMSYRGEDEGYASCCWCPTTSAGFDSWGCGSPSGGAYGFDGYTCVGI